MNNNRTATVIAGLFLLAACGHAPEPRIITREVKVPVVASCIPADFPAAPVYPDTTANLRAAGGAADRYQLLAAGRELRIYRLSELEAMLAACR